MNDISTSALVRDWVSRQPDGTTFAVSDIPGVDTDRHAAAHAFLRGLCNKQLAEAMGISIADRRYRVLDAVAIGKVYTKSVRGAGGKTGRSPNKSGPQSVDALMAQMGHLLTQLRATYQSGKVDLTSVSSRDLAAELLRRNK